MNPLVAWFLSGIGYIVLLVASIGFAGGGWRFRFSRLGRSLGTCAVLLSLTALISGSVVPSLVEIVACGSLLVGVVLMGIVKFSKQAAVGFGIGTALLAIGVGFEVRNALGIRTQVPVSDIVVVGDSLSAGIRSGEITWPTQLSRITGVPVRNLSIPGAKVSQGERMIGSNLLRNSTVIILLGGNDMLSDGNSQKYERDLLRLVRMVKTQGGVPLLIQFPAIPSKGSFPTITARVARTEKVGFIPRWVLASVLAAQGSTIDGLHLSPSGHLALAQSISRWISTVTPKEAGR